MSVQNLQMLGGLLGSTTRVQIVEHLAQEPQSPSALADALGMGLSGIIRHLDLLEEAGVIVRVVVPKTVGRSTVANFNPQGLHRLIQEVGAWAARLT